MWGINFIIRSTRLWHLFVLFCSCKYKIQIVPRDVFFPWSKVLTVWQWMWMLPLLKRMSMYTPYVDVYLSYIYIVYYNICETYTTRTGSEIAPYRTKMTYYTKVIFKRSFAWRRRFRKIPFHYGDLAIYYVAIQLIL